MFNAEIHHHPTIEAQEIHRSAYNAAFCELGLRWHWDAETYRELLPLAQESERVRAYLETQQPHLLTAYDVSFLTDAIQSTKARCYEALIACGARGDEYINWAEVQGVEACA